MGFGFFDQFSATRRHQHAVVTQCDYVYTQLQYLAVRQVDDFDTAGFKPVQLFLFYGLGTHGDELFR